MLQDRAIVVHLKLKQNMIWLLHILKQQKNFEKKDKLEKAKKSYLKAQKLLVQSNKNFPNKADTLNYLGFTTRKLGDFENGEKFYLQGLKIDPKHTGINEYLGELYVATNRHNLAVERLEVLKDCNCKEYDQLKAVIAGEKSKY
jgi:tetratricopeptide (TPR) repeat protein